MTLVPFRAANNLPTTFDLDRFFDDALRTFSLPGTATTAQWVPAVDVKNTDDHIELRADLPGMDRDNIEILIENDRLTLRGERKEESGEGTSRVERYYGRFERTFRLGNDVDAGKADATYKDGVLTIVLPKREESKPRSLKVKAS